MGKKRVLNKVGEGLTFAYDNSIVFKNLQTSAFTGYLCVIANFENVRFIYFDKTFSIPLCTITEKL